MDYANIKKQIAYMQSLVDAHEAVEAGKAIRPDAPVDIEAQKISCSNIALASASGSPKSQLIGNLSEQPTIKADDLILIGIDEKLADEMITEGAAIRADALALRVREEPIAEEIEP